MATFVLIHGACHGAWCWEKTVPLLEAAGHTAIAVDLPGHGDDPTPIANCTLNASVAAARAAIEAQSEPVVLVGHSLGGLTISQTAETIPERIDTLVYLSAFLLRDGECQRDRLGEIGSRLLANIRSPNDDGSAYMFEGPDLKEAFYHLSSQADFDRAGERLRPQPTAIGATHLHLTDARFGSVRRVYLECSEDKGLVQPFQELMYTQQPCAKVVKLPADHSPFYSMPDRLAGALTEAATH
jgi:pimeloyl-ACP methyl ester carboxylesterase